MLTGLTQKDSGTINIFGLEPEKNWEFVKNKINVSTAYFPLSDVLTVRQNLMVYAKIFHVSDPKAKINKLLNDFELRKLVNRRVIKLSSGERTRVALCKGLINDPKVLFLDECTVGLDPDIAQKTRDILKDFKKTNDATILFTSHYMYEVEELCDRIAFMSKGKIYKIDSASNLKKLIKKQIVKLVVKSKQKSLLKLLKEKDLNVIFAKGNEIHFEITQADDKVYKILNRIFTYGYKLEHLHIERPTLDDIFIKIAREQK